MAYSTANPPIQTVQGIGTAPSIWMYNSTDVHTDVDAANYFSNGSDLGMKVGDVVMVSKTNGTVGTTLNYVSAVVEGGAATVAVAILA